VPKKKKKEREGRKKKFQFFHITVNIW
jgi:hypothetical protein